MTREHKIALIVGFALVLLVGVAVSDHLSQARLARLEPALTQSDAEPFAGAPTTPIPRSTPIDTVAATPEHAAGLSTRSAGPIASSLDRERRPVTKMLARLRDRVEDMPLAAATSTNTSSAPTNHQSTQAGRSGAGLAGRADISFTWHSIKEGETLWSIAQNAYGDGSLAGKLATFNGSRTANPDLIRVGVRLRLPPKHVLTGGPAPTIRQGKAHGKTASRAARGAIRLYKIKPGDTLGEIAQRELGTIRRMGEIRALNKTTIRQPDSLPVGATIRLPAQ